MLRKKHTKITCQSIENTPIPKSTSYNSVTYYYISYPFFSQSSTHRNLPHHQPTTIYRITKPPQSTPQSNSQSNSICYYSQSDLRLRIRQTVNSNPEFPPAASENLDVAHLGYPSRTQFTPHQTGCYTAHNRTPSS